MQVDGGPRRVISASARPRMAVTALGTSGAAMPVSLTTTTSQASRSRRSLQQGGEVRRARLLLALDQQLDGDGGGVPAGGGEVRAHAEQVEGDVALVVDRAAGVQLRAVGTLDAGRLERRVHPQLGRVHRLDVVVAVDERDGRAGVAPTATRRRRRARRRSARSPPSGSRCGAAPRPATRRSPRPRRRAPGRRRSTGCAARRRGRRAGRRGGRGRSRARGCSRSPTVATTASRRCPASVRAMAGQLLRVDVGDLTFDVRADGPEDGRPVLLLHGFPQTSASWASVTPLLAAGRAAHLRARPARLLPRRPPRRGARLLACRTWRR